MGGRNAPPPVLSRPDPAKLPEEEEANDDDGMPIQPSPENGCCCCCSGSATSSASSSSCEENPPISTSAAALPLLSTLRVLLLVRLPGAVCLRDDAPATLPQLPRRWAAAGSGAEAGLEKNEATPPALLWPSLRGCCNDDDDGGDGAADGPQGVTGGGCTAQ